MRFKTRMKKVVSWFAGTVDRVVNPKPMTLRRWDAAQTNRLNSAHWARATGASLNEELQGSLQTLRFRAAHEASCNPMLKGAISTHATDVIGPDGPTFQVSSSDKEYSDAFEAIWRDWWAFPEITGRIPGPDLLRSVFSQMWLMGEFFLQMTVDKTAPKEFAGGTKALQTRVVNVHPARVGVDGRVDATVALGVRVDDNGKPTAYLVHPFDNVSSVTTAVHPIEVPADDMLHCYDVEEPGQIRGVPLVAPALQELADLRDYADQVLDAARAAADHGVMLWTNHPDSNFVAVNETTDVERRVMRTLPPGWQAQQMTPQQPTTQYSEYVRERLRALGRVVDMPLLMVLLDASNHNFSSARLDTQVYHRANKRRQGWLVRVCLNRLAARIESEAQLRGMLPVKRPPGRFEMIWTFPAPPHVDPVKEANAERIRMENGTLSYTGALANYGNDPDTHNAQRVRDRDELDRLGLPQGPLAGPRAPVAPAEGTAPAGGQPDDDPPPQGNGDDDNNGRRPARRLARRL